MHRTTLLSGLGFKSGNMGGDTSMVSQGVTVEGSGPLNVTLPGRVIALAKSLVVAQCADVFFRMEPKG